MERFKVVTTFDKDTCEICGALDGQVFKMSEYEVGITAPPFHPWCRCCTCPYYADMAGLGERWTRNPDGTVEKVPSDMSFDEWKKQFVQGAPGPKDVLTGYIQKATPGQGLITYDTGYKIGKHKEEIRIADWLHDTFGGDIKLLNEADALGVKMPDFDWRGKLWELKTVTTVKSADDALRRGLKQIRDNPGGIILDYGEHKIVLSELRKVISSRFKRGKVSELDIIVLMQDKAAAILRYKK